MTDPRMNLARALPVFSVAFAVAYVLATEMNWALFTYHPATGTWGLGVEAPKAPRQPAMYWYGWLATAALVAGGAAAIAHVAPRDLAAKSWPGLVWAIPAACMVFVLYMLRGYVLR